MRLWLVGGRQSREAGVTDRQHDGLYDEGLVCRVDPDGSIAVVHRSPGLLKGASWDGERLLVCTATELRWIDVADGSVADRWTHPWLNDVHHALRHDGGLWVASTGLDGVLERPVSGAVRLHGVLGPQAPPTTDQRGLDRTPHASHPNHLFVRDGSVWVTRFHQRDAVRVVGEGRLAVDRERPHDGVVDGDRVWFTTVDGQLVEAGGPTPRATRILDPDDDPEPLGWCRGLALAGDDAWVGFTRIRATRWRENLAWARGAFRGSQHATRRPTRLVQVTRSTGAIRATLSLEAVSMDAVFAILPDPCGGQP